MASREDRPSFFQSLHTEEYAPPPPSEETKRAVRRSRELAEKALSRGAQRFWSERLGTAAGLIALNEEFGAEFYAVPRAATEDLGAVNEALGGDQVVIDIQTHYLSDRPDASVSSPYLQQMFRAMMPSWWKGLDGVGPYNFAEYLRCVFVESETAVAVLTSGPGRDSHRQLFNEEMAGTRRLLDELAPRKRLLNHAVVHATAPEELELMSEWVQQLSPAGWKVYTMGEANWRNAQAGDARERRPLSGSYLEGSGWMLDDEKSGILFLDRVRELARTGGPKIVCAHKGISGLADTGSPRDVGPAAAAYPDLDFVIYHSGYELGPEEEGAYSEDEADVGSNRLVKSLRESDIAPGHNVYAELGTTWFWLVRRPREAAHVLGKLLLAVGEDNILWGTDSIYYGPTQQLVDAFRAFQIPLEMQQEFGYPAMTDQVKDKILSANAARVYGIDLNEARRNAENDDLAWIKEGFDYYTRRGNPV
jgi:predicted TIM-barrel fold metal-dependent hydrolase